MSTEWEKNQQQWWEGHYGGQAAGHNYLGSPNRPQGIRHYYAEKLFRHVRSGITGKLWIDVGAGTSLVIGDLIHPLTYDYRYVAIDLSKTALQHGQRRIQQTPIVGSASHLPLTQSQADVVSVLGVLQYLPDWEHTFRTLIDLLKPGGYMMLTSAIRKPRILGRWRKESYTARFASQECYIKAEELKTIIAEKCEILLCEYSASPFRFALFWFGRLDRVTLRSHRVTKIIVALDRLWLCTLGKLVRSLGPGEITLVARKRSRSSAATTPQPAKHQGKRDNCTGMIR